MEVLPSVPHHKKKYDGKSETLLLPVFQDGLQLNSRHDSLQLKIVWDHVVDLCLSGKQGDFPACKIELLLYEPFGNPFNIFPFDCQSVSLMQSSLCQTKEMKTRFCKRNDSDSGWYGLIVFLADNL